MKINANCEFIEKEKTKKKSKIEEEKSRSKRYFVTMICQSFQIFELYLNS